MLFELKKENTFTGQFMSNLKYFTCEIFYLILSSASSFFKISGFPHSNKQDLVLGV